MIDARPRRARKLDEAAETDAFSNLPHSFAETLELVFVFITVIASLGIVVALGRWWQKVRPGEQGS